MKLTQACKISLLRAQVNFLFLAGFGGQKFMTDMMSKVEFLRQHFPNLDIEVDGGVGPATIDACAKAMTFFDTMTAKIASSKK